MDAVAVTNQPSSSVRLFFPNDVEPSTVQTLLRTASNQCAGGSRRRREGAFPESAWCRHFPEQCATTARSQCLRTDSPETAQTVRGRASDHNMALTFFRTERGDRPNPVSGNTVSGKGADSARPCLRPGRDPDIPLNNIWTLSLSQICLRTARGHFCRTMRRPGRRRHFSTRSRGSERTASPDSARASLRSEDGAHISSNSVRVWWAPHAHDQILWKGNRESADMSPIETWLKRLSERHLVRANSFSG